MGLSHPTPTVRPFTATPFGEHIVFHMRLAAGELPINLVWRTSIGSWVGWRVSRAWRVLGRLSHGQAVGAVVLAQAGEFALPLLSYSSCGVPSGAGVHYVLLLAKLWRWNMASRLNL